MHVSTYRAQRLHEGKTLHIQEGLDPYNHVIVNGHQFAVARKGSVDCIDDIVVELKHFDPRKAASIAVYKQSRYAFSSYLAMLNCCYDDYYMSDHHHINIGGSFTSNPWGQSRPPARPETCTGEVNGSNETASMAASFVSTSYSHECSRTHTRQGSQISSEWSVEHDSSADGEGFLPSMMLFVVVSFLLPPTRLFIGQLWWHTRIQITSYLYCRKCFLLS